MPLRKRKGRRRREVAPSENQESVQSEENVEKKRDEEEGETVAVRDASMDEEEKRARETIALLAKKYQVSSVLILYQPSTSSCVCVCVWYSGKASR